MTISKYYTGTPFYRQGSGQDLLGVSITASTIFDQNEYAANRIYPVFKQLTLEAGNAEHFYLDDTTNRILDQQPMVKKQRNSDKERIRAGVYTSGLITTTTQDRQIILFKTNIGHAGEFIDEMLSHRDPSSPPPIIMSDTLSSNRPTVTKVMHSLCNRHGRRQYVDVISHFPQGVEQQLTNAERLVYHKKHSLPVMENIRAWGNKHLEEETVEANSGLSKAISYFDKHFAGLASFCTVEGAHLDNNLMEAQLKLVVRNRKNVMFYKTLSGASIGDVLTSMIATAARSEINVFDYFNALQRNQEAVKAEPQNYLPWNYQENI